MKRTTANNEVTFKTWVRDAKQFVDSTFRGRVFLVHDVEIVLFPVSVLAAAIGRDRETVIAWEQAGTWPKAMWQVPDKRTKRWYSQAQVLAIHKIHWEMCGGDYSKSYTRHFPLEEFHARVKAIFRKVDAETVRAAKGETMKGQSV